jgi:hypothetical protein
MKKKLWYLVPILSILLNFACEPSNPSPPAPPAERTEPNTETANWDPISVDQAGLYIYNYRANFKPQIQEANGAAFSRNQTNHVWTDVEQLEEYLKAAKFHANKFRDQPLSGIRFYFAAYTDTGGVHRHAHRKQLTLITVGTYFDKRDSIHRDIIDDTDPRNKKILSLVGGMENHGHLCPPDDPKYCDGAHFR